MKGLYSYLKKYLTDHFNLGLYLSVFVFLAIMIFLNYTYNIENDIIDSFYHTPWHTFFMSLFMGFPFLFICGLLYVFNINREWVKSKEFWLLFIFGFIVIGFSRTIYVHYQWLKELDRVDFKFAKNVIWRGITFFTIMIPILLMYFLYEKRKYKSTDIYGLTTKNTNFKPYLLLIVLVFVGIGIASFISDLTDYYPRYTKSGGEAFAKAHNFNSWIPMIIYEGVYGSDFLNVELFFRGFLVIGFSRILGGHAVLAMIGSYMFLHFGKPMTEAISSVFGGFLLGILAFYSRRIWGGVILHIALAWFMELFAWLQNTYNS